MAKSKSMAIRLVGMVRTLSEDIDKSILVASVRNNTIAFQCKGSFAWPHLTIQQAEKLQQWLTDAIAEAKARSGQ